MAKASSFSDWFNDLKDKPGNPADPAGGASGGSEGDAFWSKLKFWSNDDEAPQTPDAGAADAEAGTWNPFASSTKSSSTDWDTCGLSRTQRFKVFVACMVASFVFLGLSMTIFLPMVLLVPSKFAMSFTLGSVLFMVAFSMLSGPWSFIKGLFTSERATFSISYILSIIGTLYSCFILQSYPFVIVSASVQLAALAWFGASAVPGGRTGLRFLSKAFWATAKAIFIPCVKGIANCFVSS